MKMKLLNSSTAGLLLVTGLLGLGGCSSSYNAGEHRAQLVEQKYEREVEKREDTLDSIPDWFLEPMKSDEAGFYGVGMGQSVDLMSALRMAELNTQMKLAGNVSQLISAQEKMYNKAITQNAGRVLETSLNSFINEMDVAGTEFDRKVVTSVGDEYIVYMRGYLPVKEIKAAQEALRFAENLEIDKEDEAAELMLRVERAKAEAIRKQRIAKEEAKALAEARAARIVEREQINQQIASEH